MAYTFDGPNKRIILVATSSLNVRDLWSRWVDWVHIGTNSKYALAFSAVGGNDIDPSSGTSIPCYIFQANGWKIRPMESNHTLTVSGGVLVDLTGDPFTDTIGTYRVNIRYSQPVQAIGVASGGGTGSGGSGLTEEQIAKFEEMYEKLDVKVSSRASTGTVRNISMDGGFSKEDRKLLERVDKTTINADKAIANVSDKVDNIESIILEQIQTVRDDLESMNAKSLEIIEGSEYTLELLREVGTSSKEGNESIASLYGALDQSIEVSKEGQAKFAQLVQMSDAELAKTLSSMVGNEFASLKASLEKDSKDISTLTISGLSESESKLYKHIGDGVKYLANQMDQFDRRLEEVAMREFTISLQEDDE